MPKQPRHSYNAYRNCKWCHGTGCISCQAEADRAYKNAFPDGPKAIAVIDLTTPQGIEKGKQLISAKAIEGFILEGTQEAKARIASDSLLRTLCVSLGIPADDALARELGRQSLPSKIASKAKELLAFMTLRFANEAKRFVACKVAIKDIAVHKDAQYPDKIKAQKCRNLYECDLDGNKIETTAKATSK